MVEIHIGRHGLYLLVLLFVILGAEDVLIWVNSGALPGIEFFAGALLVLAVFALAIHEARLHPPPR